MIDLAQVVRTGFGHDTHAFDFDNHSKKLVLGGLELDGTPLSANSDGDVVLHALTNAVSGITGVNILGKVADTMCKSGITDSKAYLTKALEHLGPWRISHVSVSIEAKTPRFEPIIPAIKQTLANIFGLDITQIGLTATSGEGLSSFGQGKGIQVFAVVTAIHQNALES